MTTPSGADEFRTIRPNLLSDRGKNVQVVYVALLFFAALTIGALISTSGSVGYQPIVALVIAATKAVPTSSSWA